jgi:hypothetical protein
LILLLTLISFFRNIFNDIGVDEDSKWEDVRDKVLEKGTLHVSEEQAHTMFK